MAARDQVHTTNLQTVLALATRNANGAGAAVNLGAAPGPYAACTFFVLVGTVTDGAHNPVVVESVDGVTYTAVALSDLLIHSGNNAPKDANGNYTAAFAALASNTNQKVGYIGSQPYVSVNGVDSGGTGAAYEVKALLGSPLHLPV